VPYYKYSKICAKTALFFAIPQFNCRFAKFLSRPHRQDRVGATRVAKAAASLLLKKALREKYL
jgi:hypothetical protein